MGEIGTQYSGLPPNDPALKPYFALAEKLDLPVHIHTLGIGAHLPGFRSGAEIFVEDLPWYKIAFRVAHSKMDREPRVWALAEELVRSACSGADLERWARARVSAHP